MQIIFFLIYYLSEILSDPAKILYPELTFLFLYRIIQYSSKKYFLKKEVIIHAG